MEIIEVPVFQAMEAIAGVVKLGQVRNRTVEQFVAAFVSQTQDEFVEVIRFNSQERVSNRNAEQIIDVSVPQIREHCIEVVKVIPQERLQQHAREQIVDVSVSPTREN